MEEIIQVISNRIHELGMTQIFVSYKTGIERHALSNALNGKRKLSGTEFLNLCNLLGLNIKDFQSDDLREKVD